MLIWILPEVHREFFRSIVVENAVSTGQCLCIMRQALISSLFWKFGKTLKTYSRSIITKPQAVFQYSPLCWQCV